MADEMQRIFFVVIFGDRASSRVQLIREMSTVDVIKVRFIFVFDVADRAEIQRLRACVLCL